MQLGLSLSLTRQRGGTSRPPFPANISVFFEGGRLRVRVNDYSLPAGWVLAITTPTTNSSPAETLADAWPHAFSNVLTGNLTIDGTFYSNQVFAGGDVIYWRFALVSPLTELPVAFTAPISATVTGLSITTDNGDLIVTEASSLGTDTIEITVTEPPEYAGTYTMLVSALDDGIEVLIPPQLTGDEPAEVGDSLAIVPAAFAFDPDSYTPPAPAQPTRTMQRDGTPTADPGGLSYIVGAADAGTDLTVRDTMLLPDGTTPLHSTSAAIEVASPPAYVAYPIQSTGAQTVNIVPALPTDARTFLVAGKFRADNLTYRARLIGPNTAATLPVWGVQINTDGTFSIAVGKTGNTLAANSASGVVTAGQWVPFAAILSMDQIGETATRLRAWYATGSTERTLTQDAAAAAASGEFIERTGARLFQNDRTTSGQFGAITAETHLWLGRINGTPPDISTNNLRDTFFVSDGAGGWNWRPLGATGTVNPGGTGAISPLLFLGGEAVWGQFEGEVPVSDFSYPLNPTPTPGSGRRYLPNRADPAIAAQRAVIVMNSATLGVPA